jgi:glutathione S-transferase
VELIAIVSGLALLQVFIFAFQVGKARGIYGVNAPAISGNENFERMFRVHQNSIEQLVLFIPAIWIFGYYVSAEIGAGLGVVFIIARQIYKSAYIGDPKRRAVGFGLSALSMMILLIGGMIGAGMAYF